jgi:prepilin-type N-terminal cleavage/methylation domain-containing protein
VERPKKLPNDGRCSAKADRRGFTLVELLVVIAILAVLAALLLPALQQVREASNRAACQNNLKQLGLALQMYHDANSSFPPAAVSTPTISHGWAPFILPFIDQQSLYAQYDWDVPWYDPANQAVVNYPLQIMLCPSSPSGRVASGTTGSTSWTAAVGDYGPMRGVDPELALDGFIPVPIDFRGVMRFNQSARIAEVTDGTGNTVLLAEDAGRPQRWKAGRLTDGPTPTGAGWADSASSFILNGYDPASDS